MSNLSRKVSKNKFNNDVVKFICPVCKKTEDVPFYIVYALDKMDQGNDDYPPRFDCQHCYGKMEPVYYKNYKGKIYQYKD